MRLLYAVVAACSLQTASALVARRPPPPDLTKIYKDTVAAGNEPGSAATSPTKSASGSPTKAKSPDGKDGGGADDAAL